MPTIPKRLQHYRDKRDFTKTAEPSGDVTVLPSDHLRFVIQKHAASHLHYDLRLELDGVFKSWAVTKGPSPDPADKRLAVEVEDHPLGYGDFEGTIPQGEYGGGTVQLWDRGFWAPEGAASPEQALSKGDLKFTLAGERLCGSWVLVRMKHNRGRDTRTNWLLIKHQDEYAQPGGAAALLALDRSVASGRTMAAIAKGLGKAPRPFMMSAAKATTADAVWHSKPRTPNTSPASKPRSNKSSSVKSISLKSLPDFIEPQLCKLLDRPPAQSGWAHEVKFDGYRVQVRIARHTVSVRTRSGLDWTSRFGEIVDELKSLPDCVLDGEVVALDAHRMPSFAALQAALSEKKTADLVLFTFDLLIEGRNDVRPLPQSARKLRLQALLSSARLGPRVRYVEHFESGADAVLESACKMHLEGIVSKKLDAPYVSGRSGYWTKAKCRAGHEVVLGGWTTEARTVRSLLAGVYRDGLLVYVGRIGTGYNARVVSTLLPKLKSMTSDHNPFAGAGAPPQERNVRWLKPKLVAEIAFAGWTASGMIRQASFKGLREDKAAQDVVAEVPTLPAADAAAPDVSIAANLPARGSRAASSAAAVVMGVPLSKPDKVFWPDGDDGCPVTKQDLADYYAAVGQWMMPHLQGRPCSLLRAPDGIRGQQFFQRHAMPGMSNLLSQVKVRGDKQAYVQIDRIEALAAVAQIGALELHPWNCGRDAAEVAGRLVFDLDPAPDVPFEAVITAAWEVRRRLQDVGLESFCKTTGGKGLHVVTPLSGGTAAVTWPDAKNFAHIICAQMAADAPTKYLDTMSKAQRQGRIFLDYLRNDRTATAVAVLSPRARDGAPVSMPVEWKVVRKGLDPKRYTVRTAAALLQKTRPWMDYDAAARPLHPAIARVVSKTPAAKARGGRSRRATA
jgi:bifunctional non-homologous end joining protein LigD